jgi:large subunit ribosomal protein L12
MQYVYAALLLHASKQKVTEDAVKKVLTSAGIKPEESRIKALVAALSEVNIDEALKSAQTMAVVPVAAPAAAGGAEAGKKEEKKGTDEKKKEEEALAGLGALFG